MDEGSMHQDSLFKSCSQSTKLMEPGEGSFDDPSVDTQATAVRGVSFGQDRLDPQRSEGLAMRLGIIGPITLKLIRPSSGTAHLAGHRRHRPYQWQQRRHIVTVGSGDDRRQRNASGIGQQVMFRSVLPAVHGIRAGLRPPKTARTEELSTRAREKSIRSACRKRLSNSRWSFFHIPCCCQSRSRRQQLTPDPQPISRGRYSHGMPVVRTYIMPVRHWRFDSGLRPGYRNRLGFGCGRIGSIKCHNSSSNNAFMGGLPYITGRPQLYIQILTMPSFFLKEVFSHTHVKSCKSQC